MSLEDEYFILLQENNKKAAKDAKNIVKQIDVLLKEFAKISEKYKSPLRLESKLLDLSLFYVPASFKKESAYLLNNHDDIDNLRQFLEDFGCRFYIEKGFMSEGWMTSDGAC